MDMFLSQKVSLRNIPDSCSRFKAKVLHKGLLNFNEELERVEESLDYHMAQPEDEPKTWDENVAKINIRICNQEIKGVVLDGGSRSM